jgi:hypothetical protein
MAASKASRRSDAALRRGGGSGLLAFDGAIDGVDQHLGLDEFDPRPLGLVAIERRGKGLGEGIAVVGHSLARLFQGLKSLAHVAFAFCWWRDLHGKSVARRPSTHGWNKTAATMVRPGFSPRP